MSGVGSWTMLSLMLVDVDVVEVDVNVVHVAYSWIKSNKRMGSG